MKAVSAAQMRTLDARTIAAGISGNLLMERAGQGAAEAIARWLNEFPAVHRRRIVILAGKGNNGGDAYVAARHLLALTASPVVLYPLVSPAQLTGDAAAHAARLPGAVTVFPAGMLPDDAFRPGDVLVDGLLGTGIKGPLRPPYPEWIDRINASRLPVAALDLPSGLDGDTGEVATVAVRADLTVTIALPKRGLFLGRGPELCGRLRCVEIGIPDAFIADMPASETMTFAADVIPYLDRIPADCHKNSRGRVAVCGGSAAYAGAPLLAARCAMRTGAGYVRLLVPNAAELPGNRPDALVVNRLPGTATGFNVHSGDAVRAGLEKADALVLGPGLGAGPDQADFLAALQLGTLPTVIDADALNMLAAAPDRMGLGPTMVLTPHPGEMRRLLDGFRLPELISADRRTQAAGLAGKTGAVVVLKGHRTVIAAPDGRIAVNSSGTPGLAKAGSGDCLSGVIGTLLAQGLEPFAAATAGVFLHGYAAELSPYGCRGLTPDDLPELLAAALRQLSPFA